MNYGTIGTIIHGTLRSEDLLEVFADELERLARGCVHPGNAQTYQEIVADARMIVVQLENDPDDTVNAGAAGECVSDLMDALNEFAAPYCYFGTLEGDGADFGFWPDVESLESDVHSGDVLKLNAGDEWPDNAIAYDYVMEVTDHGNVTLYTGAGKEIWSCV